MRLVSRWTDLVCGALATADELRSIGIVQEGRADAKQKQRLVKAHQTICTEVGWTAPGAQSGTALGSTRL